MSEIKKVQVRGGFSDRRGIKPLNTKMQLDELDKRTRIGIANLLREWYDDGKFEQYRSDFCERLLKDIYSEFVDDQSRYIIGWQNNKFIESYIYLPISANSYDEVLTIPICSIGIVKKKKRRNRFGYAVLRYNYLVLKSFNYLSSFSVILFRTLQSKPFSEFIG